MTMPSIKPAKLADAIADHIQKLILEGALQPGERLLAERDLSAKLNVSRPSLREALDKLIVLGLLETDAKGVSYVSESVGKSLRDPLFLLMEDPEATIDYLEFRAVVEAAAAGYAAQRASRVDSERIRDQFERMKIAHQNLDTDEIAKADADFHIAIYEASHNLFVLHFMRIMETMLRSNVYLNRKSLYEYRGNHESQLEEHQAIFEAIMARDADRAREAARHHVAHALDTLKEIRDAEKRLEVSIRRLERDDLVAPAKKRSRSA